nr:hypothetical protein [Tanacetum cinerariifolium]
MLRDVRMDMISNLPSNIIEIVLCFLPIQKAVKTSILSREWRNSPNLEKLEIDNRELDQDDSNMEDELCTKDELYSFTVDSYPDIWLEHLNEVNITLNYSAFDEDEEFQILLILLRFPQASPVVEIII